MMKSALKGKGRNSVRDRVSVKNLFSLFLLWSRGGYVLDTNIIPLQKSNMEFKNYDRFTIPLLPGKKPECWMMYSPKNNKGSAQSIFSRYLKNYQSSELRYKRDLINIGQFYELQGGEMIRAIAAEEKESSLGKWNVERKEGDLISTIKSLGILKVYNNTHKYERRGKFDKPLFPEAKDNDPDVIFAAVTSGSLHYLSVLIEAKSNVNARIKKFHENQFEGETPLHYAYIYNNLEIFEKLLASGANPDLKAEYKEGQFSIRDLIMKRAWNEEGRDVDKYQKILEDYDKKVEEIKSSSVEILSLFALADDAKKRDFIELEEDKKLVHDKKIDSADVSSFDRLKNSLTNYLKGAFKSKESKDSSSDDLKGRPKMK